MQISTDEVSYSSQIVPGGTPAESTLSALLQWSSCTRDGTHAQLEVARPEEALIAHYYRSVVLPGVTSALLCPNL